MLLGRELLEAGLASNLISFVIHQIELLILLLQNCAEYWLLARFETAMINEIRLLLVLYLRRMLAGIFAHLRGWSLIMVTLHYMRD